MNRALVAIVALLIYCGTVQAEPYAIFGAGVSKIDAAGSNQATAVLSGGVGFRINKAIALEAAFSHFGAGGTHVDNSSSSVTSGSGDRTNTAVKEEWKGSGVGLFLAGFHPVSPSVSLVGRVGAYRLKGETKTTTTADLFPAVGTATQTKTEQVSTERIWVPTIGLGIQERAGDHASFRGMLEYVNGRHGEFKRALMVSVSLLYSF